MTLTPQDKKIIERARIEIDASEWDAFENAKRLLVILDRLAGEENAQPDDVCARCMIRRKNHDHMIHAFADHYEEKQDAAPSSPLPDAICARCGKTYYRHFDEKKCYVNSGDAFLSTPDKPKQDEAEIIKRDKLILRIIDKKIAASEARIMAEIEKLAERVAGLEDPGDDFIGPT
jgi:hypothetical protein